MNKIKLYNQQLLIGAIVGAVAVGLIGSVTYFSISKSAWLPTKEIESKLTQFVKAELLQGKGSATVKVVGKEGDLYKLEVSYNGQKIDSFVSKDGKRFFPQALAVLKNGDTKADANGGQSKTEPAADEVSKKTDKPTVELFVMSYCPYGTQMEKGILPAVEALGDKIDFKLKFVSYTMHGDKERKENLLQYCISKEQSAKFYSYLQCFLGNSDAAACLKSTGIDEAKTNSCMTAAAKQFNVTGTNFSVHKEENDKYGVQGSPTLVINGAQSQSARDSRSLLKSICSAFNNPPKECSIELSGDTPAPGFGSGAASSGGSAAAGCATN